MATESQSPAEEIGEQSAIVPVRARMKSRPQSFQSTDSAGSRASCDRHLLVRIVTQVF